VRRAIEIGKVFRFQVSQRIVATKGEMKTLYNGYTQNFLGNPTAKEFWKSVYICPIYDQNQVSCFLRHSDCSWNIVGLRATYNVFISLIQPQLHEVFLITLFFHFMHVCCVRLLTIMSNIAYSVYTCLQSTGANFANVLSMLILMQKIQLLS